MTDWERWKYTIPEDMSRYRIPFLAWASPEQTTGKYTMVCPVCDTVMPEWNGDARRWTNIVPNYADLAPEFLWPCPVCSVSRGLLVWVGFVYDADTDTGECVWRDTQRLYSTAYEPCLPAPVAFGGSQ
jgi:hypothetical protein